MAKQRGRGRPTKLTPAKLKKANEYLEAKRAVKECPFVEELAVYELNVDRHTVADWVSKADDKDWLKKKPAALQKLHRDFSSTIKKLADMQLLYLKVKGINDQRNSVAIFLMKADHGMVETSRHEHTGPDGGPIRYRAVEVMKIKDRAKAK